MLCFEQKTLEARIMAFIFDSSSSDEWLTKKKKKGAPEGHDALSRGQKHWTKWYIVGSMNILFKTRWQWEHWLEWEFHSQSPKVWKRSRTEKKKVQKLNWQSDAGSSSCTKLNCDSPPQYQSWFCSHGVRCTLCILAGLCPCQCWHTGTTCWSCWIWWGQFHNHTERSARRPFSSGQTSSSWKSPMKTEFKNPFKCNT